MHCKRNIQDAIIIVTRIFIHSGIFKNIL